MSQSVMLFRCSELNLTNQLSALRTSKQLAMDDISNAEIFRLD